MNKIDVYEAESSAAPWTVVLLDASREAWDDRIVMTMKATEQEANDWVSEQEVVEGVRYVVIEDTNLQRVGDRFRNFQEINFADI